jgi:APA family basic amino acid/polyamine antiporter
MTEHHELRRTIGLGRATALVVGTIIGASIFVQPSVITGRIPSAAGVYLVWIAAGGLTLLGALVAAELASAFPRTGGVYVFLKEAWSPALGFLWGWAMFWSMHSGIIAAIAVIFARYLAFFIPMGDIGIRVCAALGIVLLSAVNVLGVRHGSVLQTAFTAVKLLAIGVIIAVGFGLGAATPAAPAAAPAAAPLRFGDFILAVAAGLFAFGGWHMVTYTAGETVNPERTIPRALLVGTLVVTACYIAMNAVYIHILPIDRLIGSDRVAADAADAVLGGGGAAVMSGLVVFSSFGALSGIVLAGPRVYYSMARDGLLFGWLGNVHPRFRTPHRAIVLQALWSVVLVATGTYQVLFTRVVYTEWIFFAFMAAGLFRLRRRPDYAPVYRVGGYPLVPALFVAASAAVVINQVVSDPLESAFGLGLVLAGWPIHALWVSRPGRREEGPRADHRLP